jgi:ABC-type glycerol-3-phosphate transport system permease component
MINKILTGTFFKAVLVINALMVLLPVFFLFNTALRDSDSFGANPIEFARSPEWNNFAEVWADGEFPTFLKNSLVITLGSLVVILVCALGAGFILGRYQFKGNSLIYGFVLTGMLVPAKLAILPLFIQLKWMNLIDSHLGLILVYASGALPAAIFIMA